MKDKLYITFLPTYVAPVLTPLFLDDYPGAAAAYSFRKLRNAYAGQCFRIRRSSDNDETDICFVGNYVDEAAIQSFIGASSASIAVWYDQSTNARDATQTTGSGQYRIALNGVIDKVAGQIVALKSSNQTMDIPSFNHVDSYWVTQGNTNGIFIYGTYAPYSGSEYGAYFVNGSTSTVFSSGIGSPTVEVNGNGLIDRNDGYDKTSLITAAVSQRGANITGTEKALTYTGLSGYGFAGNVFEHIEYATTQASYLDIIANQKAYYGIL